MLSNSRIVKRVMHIKGRRTCNQPCQFGDCNKLELHEVGDKCLTHDHIVRPSTDENIQVSPALALSTCNTDNFMASTRGVTHTEGGWPKDVNLLDSEQVTRYRKKIEREDIFARQVGELCRRLEAVVLQNNAVNIYQDYFNDVAELPIAEKCSAKTTNTFKDFTGERRPLNNISWAPELRHHIVASYCDQDECVSQPHGIPTDSCVWDLANPNTPLQILSATSAPNCIRYNVKDFHLLVGGLFSGQVALWDPRSGSLPTGYSARCASHRSCVNSVQWLSSKSNTEFFSGAGDGQVLTWDSRKMQVPTERLLMDPHRCEEAQMERCFGVTVLEFEQTIPAKFMVATMQGVCFSCNRKGKSVFDKISIRTQCHTGPVHSLERNPSFVKIFLTVGDWQAKVWSEECKESAIIWTRAYSDKPLAGTWSRTRCSLFFVCRMSGVFEAWDLLLDQHDPVLCIKICDTPLISITAHENGESVAVGSLDGTMYLIELSPNLVRQQRNEKTMFTAMLERETRREKIIEGKIKEMKLKQKTALEEIAIRKLKQERLRKIEEDRQVEEANRAAAVAAGGPGSAEVQGMVSADDSDDDLETRTQKEYFAMIELEKQHRSNDAKA